jgi:hypothetical protein
MPHPGLWTSEPHDALVAPAVLAGGMGDVISGPVMIGEPASVKAELERVMTQRDAQFGQAGPAANAGAPGSEATEPMDLATEPMRLR